MRRELQQGCSTSFGEKRTAIVLVRRERLRGGARAARQGKESSSKVRRERES